MTEPHQVSDPAKVGAAVGSHRFEVDALPGVQVLVHVQCRCVWHDVHCPRPASQEDGFCDWCGTRRLEDLRSNPKTLIAPDGEVMCLGGGWGPDGDPPYEHQAGQAGISADVRPTACWMEADASDA